MSAPRSAFDEYALKARVFPAALIGAPVATLLFFAGKQDFAWAVPAVMFFAVSTLSSQLLLHRGRLTEQRLISEWGGMPTTLALKWTAVGSKKLLLRRRADVERVAGIALPSARRERDHQSDALEEYTAAVGLCIDRVRSGEQGSRLLFNENVAYGFRRNLRAGRKIGLIVSVVTFAVSVALTIAGGVSYAAAAAVLVNVVAVLVWIFGVRDQFVRDQADKYADRFFRVLEGVKATAAQP